MIRHARRDTGRRLEAATTVTVTRDNLDGRAGHRAVAGGQCRRLQDGELPAGRARRAHRLELEGVTADELWQRPSPGSRRIGAPRHPRRPSGLARPSRLQPVRPGRVVRQAGAPPAFRPLFGAGRSRAIGPPRDAWLGALRRPDLPARHARPGARPTGGRAGRRRLGLVLGRIVPFLLRRPARLDPGHPWRLVARRLLGRARIDYLNIVSHHFMGGPSWPPPRAASAWLSASSRPRSATPWSRCAN